MNDERNRKLDQLRINLDIVSHPASTKDRSVTPYILEARGLIDDLKAKPDRPLVAHGFTERQIREAAHAVRVKKDRSPTRPEVAGRLHTSESTLKRSMKAHGMTRWPPPAPED